MTSSHQSDELHSAGTSGVPAYLVPGANLLGMIVAAPLRIVNVPVKAAGAVLDTLCGERPRIRKNGIDRIADVVEAAADEITGGKQ